MAATTPDSPLTPGRRLERGYYVASFTTVLATVVERYGDLLAADELRFARDFGSLGVAARQLYVRLVSRRGPCFRRDRLTYDEIPKLEGAIGELTEAGFVDVVDRGHDVEPRDLLRLLVRDELIHLGAELLGPLPAVLDARRPALVARLAADVEPDALWRAIGNRIQVIRRCHAGHVRTYRLLFFGNLSQDLSEFVMRDLGLIRYEDYELHRDLRRFPSRVAIDHALALRAARDRVDDLLAAGELTAAVAIADDVRAQLGDWYPASRPIADAILSRTARALERSGRYDGAIALYEAATGPPARERRARLLARVGRVDQALALCREIAAEPCDETERAFGPRFGYRLQRARDPTLPPPPRPGRPRVTFELGRVPGATAEWHVVEALRAVGRQAFFSENYLWRSLFGLAFWDIIFAPVPGAFQHPFQFGPLDLYDEDFRRRRADRIEERLDELRRDDGAREQILSVFDQKRDRASSLVAWHPELGGRLELALTRIRGDELAYIFDRLSRSIARYGSGLPDLFVCGPDAGFELYEVKAEGDQIRPEQGAWIDYLNAGGIRTSVVHVKWSTPVGDDA